MPKKYDRVEHTGTKNRIEEAKKHGSNPEVMAGNKVTHNVDGDTKAFEAHVKEFEGLGKRKEMGAMNKPFKF
jgi:hypothetical protein